MARNSDQAPPEHKAAQADNAKRRRKGEATRQAILDAAIEVLATKGRRGLRVTELAEAVGVKHTNLTYYFGSKERLLREAVEERQRQEQAFYYGVPEDEWRLSQLPNAARVIEENSLLTRLYVVLGAESLDADDDLHEFFVARYQRARQRIVRAIQNEKTMGILRPDVDEEQISFEVIAFMMGLEIQWLMDPASVEYVRRMEAYAKGLYERFAQPDLRPTERQDTADPNSSLNQI